ncbi:MAG: hypothetical protein R3B71_01405 [Candidatus Gracilibacteria bacterium]
MDRVLAFILGVPLGFLIMIYRYKLKQITGDVAWAEQYLGSGGTYNLFILIGLAVTILSIMYAFGSLQELTAGTVGVFFR